MGKRVAQVVFGLLALWLLVFMLMQEPKRPSLPKWELQERLLDQKLKASAQRQRRERDVKLVKMLLEEGLKGGLFDFRLIAEAVSGKKVIPAGKRTSSLRVIGAIEKVMDGVLVEMVGENSPVRGLSRIHEVSKFFEDALRKGLDEVEGLQCGIPETREGQVQRSGYPDLRILDEDSGDVYYLDPKLVDEGAVESSFRTFYFEPKDETLKITEDATHLLIGIEHNGKDGDWKFLRYRVVDLWALQVRLKAEFQASNRELYSERTILEKSTVGGKDGGDE